MGGLQLPDFPEHRFIAELDGEVAGWVAVVPYSQRTAYRRVAEESVYVEARARGRGVGRVLLETLIERARDGGLWTLQAGVFTENAASLALHRSLGFREVGVRERIGQLNDAWRDVVLLELLWPCNSLLLGGSRRDAIPLTPAFRDQRAK